MLVEHGHSNWFLLSGGLSFNLSTYIFVPPFCPNIYHFFFFFQVHPFILLCFYILENLYVWEPGVSLVYIYRHLVVQTLKFILAQGLLNHSIGWCGVRFKISSSILCYYCVFLLLYFFIIYFAERISSNILYLYKMTIPNI